MPGRLGAVVAMGVADCSPRPGRRMGQGHKWVEVWAIWCKWHSCRCMQRGHKHRWLVISHVDQVGRPSASSIIWRTPQRNVDSLKKNCLIFSSKCLQPSKWGWTFEGALFWNGPLVHLAHVGPLPNCKSLRLQIEALRCALLPPLPKQLIPPSPRSLCSLPWATFPPQTYHSLCK